MNRDLKLDVKKAPRPTSSLTNYRMIRKQKMVRAPSLVEIFPNIKQQFEIDVDAIRIALVSKNILLFVFQFIETVKNN